jgi:hypothetical protein
MIKRAILLGVPALVAGVLVGIAPAGAAVPTNTATKVPLTAGANVVVSPNLNSAGSIAGQVTAAAGGSISGSIFAYRNGNFISSGFIDGTGHYQIGGLGASATGYAICVSPFGIFGGNSTTGYLGRCYKTAAFNGSSVPSGATKVPLTDGQQKTNINITIPSGAAISGKVVNSAGKAIPGVSISTRSKSSSASGFAITNANGVFKILGLPGSANGYGVCASSAFLTAGATGYLSRCWKNVAWNGGTIPSGANAVSVSLGHTHTGINITLPRGAAISGAITDAANGHPLNHAGVAALNSAGGFLATASTNSTGHYTLKGLPASTSIRVCAFAFSTATLTTETDYKGKCWKNATWNGGRLPSGTTGVKTTLGKTHTGINLKLNKSTIHLGSIAGTVRETGGAAVQAASVMLMNSSGGFVDSTQTDMTGHYKLSRLRANSTGYVVCVRPDESAFSPTTPTPDTGWAPRCHTDVAWNGLGVPGGANKVPLTAGQNRTGIDVTLHVGGEISGIVSNTGLKTSPIDFVTVEIFTATGRSLATTSSAFDGTYDVKGLAPNATGYIVCFDGRTVGFGVGPGYLPECWQDQPWDGNG